MVRGEEGWGRRVARGRGKKQGGPGEKSGSCPRGTPVALLGRPRGDGGPPAARALFPCVHTLGFAMLLLSPLHDLQHVFFRHRFVRPTSVSSDAPLMPPAPLSTILGISVRTPPLPPPSSTRVKLPHPRWTGAISAPERERCANPRRASETIDFDNSLGRTGPRPDVLPLGRAETGVPRVAPHPLLPPAKAHRRFVSGPPPPSSPLGRAAPPSPLPTRPPHGPGRVALGAPLCPIAPLTLSRTRKSKASNGPQATENPTPAPRARCQPPQDPREAISPSTSTSASAPPYPSPTPSHPTPASLPRCPPPPFPRLHHPHVQSQRGDSGRGREREHPRPRERRRACKKAEHAWVAGSPTQRRSRTPLRVAHAAQEAMHRQDTPPRAPTRPRIRPRVQCTRRRPQNLVPLPRIHKGSAW